MQVQRTGILRQEGKRAKNVLDAVFGNIWAGI